MAQRKKIEVYSAGWAACQDVVMIVKRLAGATHEVEVLDMLQANIARRAKQLGIERVPSIVIDGQLAACCTSRGPDEATLRAAIQS
jgi:glutaredoxin 3